MRALGLMTCGTLLLSGCSFTTAGGLTECETSADCDSAQVCNAGFCLPQPEGCGLEFGPASATNAIALGAALPLTTADGKDESEEQALNSIKLAIEEVNQREGINGRPFVLYICDTRSDANRARAQAEWLVKEKEVPVIFTSGSAQTITVSSATIAAGVLLMTHTGTSPDIATLPDKPRDATAGLVWRTAPSDSVQGRIIADLLEGTLPVQEPTPPFANIDNVVLSYVDDPYGQGLSGVVLRFLDAPGINVQSAKYSRNGDVTSAVGTIGSAQPDITVMAGFSEDNAKIVSQLVAQGRTGQRWFFTDASKDRGLFTALGINRSQVEGAYGTAPAQARPNDPVYRLFEQRFRSAYLNQDPGQYSFTAHAYDAMYLVALGTAYAVGPDNSKPQPITGARIAEGLARMTPPRGETAPAFELGFSGFIEARAAMRAGTIIDVKGASGELDFDAAGEAPSEYELWKIENGTFKTVQLINPSTN
ncbi:ABC transporter substrate-binding protein [Pyxidicoccus fallax]|uniref:Amino acid ABC transporter substrate-binding protein n=1 Tax=Pyxidicoccus fallax TaxID=394095 RepID=A0A848LWU7_9BACT|nr:ABC transporter substrate-binding protein [Pyxidicoccus fallax]NMO22109.1 amino acid ABC transporter substrate-binding protein [Pyxidicoccus fallax]NPC83698.1 ABC transporter substrate-binding protein [Pyxidicoccus fallax]